MRSTTVGRLAVWLDDHPDIFPLNFVVDQGTVVFRTGEGTKVAGISGTPVALEADGLDEATGEAWSVVVRGRAHSITEQHDVMDTADLPLHPRHGGRKDRFVRITPDVISGRRFAVADPSVWRTGSDHRSAATD
ncbi:pyridoxamine 5'-phosphate oxidase family protein [Janibacter limosus]|uniref:pyridoxamine 5'-phosphate oxidase family protein n=1 Tax=Janibacter limosus TaxID=53458 RepID=UPI0035D89CAA|nr:pyridoxamine 5'-phosphate oxidase family protein [Janibacter limosus]